MRKFDDVDTPVMACTTRILGVRDLEVARMFGRVADVVDHLAWVTWGSGRAGPPFEPPDLEILRRTR